jgi:hypothetical protein
MTGGTYGPWRPIDSPSPCPKCGVVGRITYRLWESDCGGFEDTLYRCEACGKDWWIEGPDA